MRLVSNWLAYCWRWKSLVWRCKCQSHISVSRSLHMQYIWTTCIQKMKHVHQVLCGFRIFFYSVTAPASVGNWGMCDAVLLKCMGIHVNTAKNLQKHKRCIVGFFYWENRMHRLHGSYRVIEKWILYFKDMYRLWYYDKTLQKKGLKLRRPQY